MTKNRKNLKVVLSGANGFVGQGVIDFFSQQSADIHVLHRRPWNKSKKWVTTHHIPNFLTDTESVEKAMEGTDVFIHLAGRAHQSGEQKDYENSIVNLTKTLLESATKSGVKHFIYISTILVHGTQTHGIPINEGTPPNPQNWYAATKWQAEQCVKDYASKNSMTYTIIRPPLVYGPNLKGNLRKLLWLVKLRLPLPFKNIHNKRSLISLQNLSSLIWHCSIDKRAINQTYVVADGVDVSTPDIICFFAQGLKKRPLLFSFPTKILMLFLKIIGRQKMIEQLFGSLQIDNKKSRHQLGWIPIKPVNIAMPEATQTTRQG